MAPDEEEQYALQLLDREVLGAHQDFVPGGMSTTELAFQLDIPTRAVSAAIKRCARALAEEHAAASDEERRAKVRARVDAAYHLFMRHVDGASRTQMVGPEGEPLTNEDGEPLFAFTPSAATARALSDGVGRFEKLLTELDEQDAGHDDDKLAIAAGLVAMLTTGGPAGELPESNTYGGRPEEIEAWEDAEVLPDAEV